MKLTKQQSYAIASKIHSALQAERAALVDKAKKEYVKSKSKEVQKVTSLIRQIPEDIRDSFMSWSYKKMSDIQGSVTSLYENRTPSLSDIKSVPSVNDIERDVVLASIDSDNLEALYKKFGVTIK